MLYGMKVDIKVFRGTKRTNSRRGARMREQGGERNVLTAQCMLVWEGHCELRYHVQWTCTVKKNNLNFLKNVFALFSNSHFYFLLHYTSILGVIFKTQAPFKFKIHF